MFEVIIVSGDYQTDSSDITTPDLDRLAMNAPSMTLEKKMSLSTILLIVLVLLLIGAIPTWPHSRSWGYYPSGGLGLVVVILLILWLMGRI